MYFQQGCLLFLCAPAPASSLLTLDIKDVKATRYIGRPNRAFWRPFLFLSLEAPRSPRRSFVLIRPCLWKYPPCTRVCLGLADQMPSFSVMLGLARMQGSDRHVFAIEKNNEMWAWHWVYIRSKINKTHSEFGPQSLDIRGRSFE